MSDGAIPQAAAPRDDAVAVETPFRRFCRDFAESRIATAALVVLAAIILIALFAPWVAPTDPYDLSQVSILDSKLKPGSQSMDGLTYWLGTDGAGRDLVSAIIYGLRISLGVGVMSGVFALCIGTAVGLTAAYFGGRVDAFIMRV
ncbi:MAG: peptide ABC transporter permease, partial [Rhodospirillales bacterium CG15_BIG_FIL_POST_REV_8_21_14_020_66_15]